MSLVHSTQMRDETAQMGWPLPAQSLLVWQAGAHRCAAQTQTSPGAHSDASSHSTHRRSSRSQKGVVGLQSAFVKQPVQLCVTVLQTRVGQSSFARHWTHSPDNVKQKAFGVWHSSFDVHFGAGPGPVSAFPASVRRFGVPPRRAMVFASLQLVESDNAERIAVMKGASAGAGPKDRCIETRVCSGWGRVCRREALDGPQPFHLGILL